MRMTDRNVVLRKPIDLALSQPNQYYTYTYQLGPGRKLESLEMPRKTLSTQSLQQFVFLLLFCTGTGNEPKQRGGLKLQNTDKS